MDDNGAIVASSGIVGTVSHTPGSGIYDLTLERNGDSCAAIASEGAIGTFSTGGIAQAAIAGTHLEVHTQYYSGGFFLGDERFSVAVFC